MVQREDTLTKPGYGAATVPRLAVAITGKVWWRMTTERSLAKGVQARKYFMIWCFHDYDLIYAEGCTIANLGRRIWSSRGNRVDSWPLADNLVAYGKESIGETSWYYDRTPWLLSGWDIINLSGKGRVAQKKILKPEGNDSRWRQTCSEQTVAGNSLWRGDLRSKWSLTIVSVRDLTWERSGLIKDTRSC